MTTQERRDICKACPFFQSDGRCSLCGCYMRIKTLLPAARCPDHRW